ncbi:MAG: hypothetical protein JWM31_3439 [Solirubrobacterales bacterium]|nr:hypothetical protein [Solirubrobacterales bacterium]
MTWFRVDDDLAFHRKTVRAGNAAMGLWVRAGAWCSQQLSDGVVPADIARTLGKPSEIKALVTAELWEIDGDSYRFHDYFTRNPSRAEVEQRREAEAKKKADWRAKREAQRAGQGTLSTGDTTGDNTGDSPSPSPRESTGVSDGVSRSSRPDPTRPSTSNEVLTTPTKPLRAVAEIDNAGQVMGLWLESLTRRPPSAVVGQIAKQVKTLLADKFTPQEIIDGLNAWQAKGLHPSTLPSVVNETINKPKRPTYTDEVRQPVSAFSAVAK